MPNIRKQRTTANLPYRLTKKERLEAADALGEAAKAVKEAEASKKAAKNQLDVAKDEHDRLAAVVSSGVEYRDIEVEECVNLDRGVFTQTRLDTGEIVIERPLSDYEKQTTLVPGSA